jgi:hypothetical protein
VCNLSYTFNAVNALTAVTDGDEARYAAALTCDQSGNITQVVEVYNNTATPPVAESTLTTDFTYDALNRLTQHKTTRYDLAAGRSAALGGGELIARTAARATRDHTLDGTGRVAKSAYSTCQSGSAPPLPHSSPHVSLLLAASHCIKPPAVPASCRALPLAFRPGP